MNNKNVPTPRTDSGWSWADFWNWYIGAGPQLQAETVRMNDLYGQIDAMTPDVQHEVLYYAPVYVQEMFERSPERTALRNRIQKILRSQ